MVDISLFPAAIVFHFRVYALASSNCAMRLFIMGSSFSTFGYAMLLQPKS